MSAPYLPAFPSSSLIAAVKQMLSCPATNRTLSFSSKFHYSIQVSGLALQSLREGEESGYSKQEVLAAAALAA